MFFKVLLANAYNIFKSIGVKLCSSKIPRDYHQYIIRLCPSQFPQYTIPCPLLAIITSTFQKQTLVIFYPVGITIMCRFWKIRIFQKFFYVFFDFFSIVDIQHNYTIAWSSVYKDISVFKTQLFWKISLTQYQRSLWKIILLTYSHGLERFSKRVYFHTLHIIWARSFSNCVS